MRQFSFLQLDVFTDRAFTGNPLAVFPDGEGLTDIDHRGRGRQEPVADRARDEFVGDGLRVAV